MLPPRAVFLPIALCVALYWLFHEWRTRHADR